MDKKSTRSVYRPRGNVTPRDTSTQQRSARAHTHTHAHNTAQLTRPHLLPLDKQALGPLPSFLRCLCDSPDCPLVQLEQSRPYSALSEGTASGSAPRAPTHTHANSSRRCAQTRRQPIFPKRETVELGVSRTKVYMGPGGTSR